MFIYNWLYVCFIVVVHRYVYLFVLVVVCSVVFILFLRSLHVVIMFYAIRMFCS